MLVECSVLYSSLFLNKSSPEFFNQLWDLLQHPVSPLMLGVCSEASPLWNNDGIGEGSGRQGIVPETCPWDGRDCSPCCIWKLQSSPWIHFHHCGLYISTCMPTYGKKIIFPYNLGGKEEIDHYCFPSLNILEVIRVLMKASVWCWVWKGV